MAQTNFGDGANTYDAAFPNMTFIPDSNVMTMQFVFSSDEYPELDPNTGQGYGTAARRTLRKFEARLLLQNAWVA